MIVLRIVLDVVKASQDINMIKKALTSRGQCDNYCTLLLPKFNSLPRSGNERAAEDAGAVCYVLSRPPADVHHADIFLYSRKGMALAVQYVLYSKGTVNRALVL